MIVSGPQPGSAQSDRRDPDGTARQAPARRLRILFVTPRYFPHVGGVEVHTNEIARRMAAAGHDVTVLTVDTTGKLASEEQVDGIRVRRVRAWPRGRDYFFSPALYAEIRGDILPGGRPDLVHCQSYQTLVAPAAMLAAWRAGIPYVVTFHSGGHSSPLRNRIRGLQRRLLRPLLARSARLVAVSKFEVGLFEDPARLPKNRFAVIPNGSQLRAVEARADEPGNGAGHPHPLLISVGRLERYKGHQRVIAAFPQVLARYPRARLRVVGSGPFEADLRRLVDRLGLDWSVEIGSIQVGDRGGMAELLSAASLVVLLSDFEAHPISVMEALALGRPVLATYTSGLAELADQGLISTVPLNSSAEEVAQAMFRKLQEPPLPGLRPGTFEVPTWEECTTSLLDLYWNVIEESACAS